MPKISCVALLFPYFYLTLGLIPPPPASETAAEFVGRAEQSLWRSAQRAVVLEWAYDSNITDHNEKQRLQYQKIADRLRLHLGTQAQHFDPESITDRDVRRKLGWIATVGTALLPKRKRDRYNQLANDIVKIYSTAKVPKYGHQAQLLSLEPSIEHALAVSRDPSELEYYWTQWREVTGKKMREMHLERLDLLNEAARLNGFADASQMKTTSYESETFLQEMEETWQGLKPLYEQVHAYARHKLAQRYGSDVVPEDGPIPAHLVGNMWAQSWGNIAKLLRPFPNKPDIDVTDEMVKKGWTPKIMFKKADEFFQSMGFEPMTETFWAKSILERPSDGRELICHASAWDFFTEGDFRIKQCTGVNQEDFITVNHEMGHTQYQMSYRNQSFLYRSGANSGFHEGVADVLGLAVGTATYLQHLGLLSENVDIADEETNINILFNTALGKLVFMPFGYLTDKYRWDLYRGLADEKDMNCHWVKLRLDIQGVSPPSKRSESDFDAGAKFHVAGGIGYIRYFTAHIYQFQFYRQLCLVAGQYDPNDPDKPLHRCNFFGSKEAGEKLKSMLELGASKPWKEVMEVMTGEPKMDTAAFREYFKPLEDWLKKENARNGVKVGWNFSDYKDYCE